GNLIDTSKPVGEPASDEVGWNTATGLNGTFSHPVTCGATAVARFHSPGCAQESIAISVTGATSAHSVGLVRKGFGFAPASPGSRQRTTSGACSHSNVPSLVSTP